MSVISAISKGLKVVALAIVAAIAAIVSRNTKSMSDDQIMAGVGDGSPDFHIDKEKKIEMIWTNDAMNKLIQDIKKGEQRLWGVKGHGLVIARDNDGQVIVADNGGGKAMLLPWFFKKAFEDNNVQYVAFKTNKSCGESAQDIMNNLKQDANGNIDLEEIAKKMNCGYQVKQFGNCQVQQLKSIENQQQFKEQGMDNGKCKQFDKILQQGSSEFDFSNTSIPEIEGYFQGMKSSATPPKVSTGKGF